MTSGWLAVPFVSMALNAGRLVEDAGRPGLGELEDRGAGAVRAGDVLHHEPALRRAVCHYRVRIERSSTTPAEELVDRSPCRRTRTSARPHRPARSRRLGKHHRPGQIARRTGRRRDGRQLGLVMAGCSPPRRWTSSFLGCSSDGARRIRIRRAPIARRERQQHRTHEKSRCMETPCGWERASHVPDPDASGQDGQLVRAT